MALVKLNKNGNLFPAVWSDFFDNDSFFSHRWFDRELESTLPAVNIRENDSEFNVEFAAPGFNKKDFKINVEENTLIISAEKQEETREEKEHFTRKEFSYNSFSRSFTLPQNVNANQIDAKYNEGILKLHIPKKEESKKLLKKEVKIT